MSEAPIPPGFGPLLARSSGMPESRRLSSKIFLVGFCLAFVVFEGSRGTGWWLSSITGTLLFAALYAANFGVHMRAGDGWFARSDSFVRTDRLVRLWARGTLCGLRVLMIDADGRKTYGHLSHLTDDPKIWALVLAGVRTSVARGLIVDDTLTARVFGVAPPPRRPSRKARATAAPNRSAQAHALAVDSQTEAGIE